MKESGGLGQGLKLTLAVFAVVFACVCLLVNLIDSASGGMETELVRDAVRSAALTCYAVEGAYPMELDYLKERYGLAYDEKRFVVEYDADSVHGMPVIQVLTAGGEGA